MLCNNSCIKAFIATEAQIILKAMSLYILLDNSMFSKFVHKKPITILLLFFYSSNPFYEMILQYLFPTKSVQVCFFCRDDKGNISLWRLYNLHTTCNKSSWIDSFLDRGVNASELASSLAQALEHQHEHWFMS